MYKKYNKCEKGLDGGGGVVWFTIREWVMLITGALQNVTVLPVVRRAADKDNSEGNTLIGGGAVEKQEETV